MCSHRAASLQLTVSTVASLSKTARPRTKPAKGYQEITSVRVKHCATSLSRVGLGRESMATRAIRTHHL
jgi:hypothetical protein